MNAIYLMSYVFLLQHNQMIPIYLLKILYNHFASYAYIIKYNLCQILNKIIKFITYIITTDDTSFIHLL